jgi:hypothetical protein
VDNKTGITDALAPEVERGRMTRSEAIRHILDRADYSDYPGPDRTREALDRLGISPGSIKKAEELP